MLNARCIFKIKTLSRDLNSNTGDKSTVQYRTPKKPARKKLIRTCNNVNIFFLHRTRTTTPNPRNRTDMQKSIRTRTQTRI